VWTWLARRWRGGCLVVGQGEAFGALTSQCFGAWRPIVGYTGRQPLLPDVEKCYA